MSVGGGDLVTVMTLDDFEFVTGLRRSANETSKFAGQVNGAGSSLSGGFGRAIGQMGFAAQDFSSVMSMGGKNALGRALMGTMNNVQMLGAAFGPAGMAITSVAGALGSIFIPKLFEAEAASDALAKKIQTTATEAERASDSFERMARFSAKIAAIKTASGAESMATGLSTDIKVTEHRAKMLSRAADQSGNALLSSGNYFLPSYAKDYSVADQLRNVKNKKGDSDKDPNLIEAKKLADDLEKAEREAAKLRAERSQVGDAQKRLTEEEAITKEMEDQRDLAKDMMAENRKEERELKQAREKKERDAERFAEHVRRDNMTPFEKAQEQLAQINDASGLDDDAKAKAKARIIDDFAKQKGTKDPENNVALKGSAEAASAIRDAITSQAKSEDSEQVKLLKRIADAAEAKKPDAPVKIEVVGIED
ncbi:MAG TPA: hypothetical protein VGH74_07570 [Planctomycetaceae bacterium]|jgi:hypothetical protein